MPPTRSDIFLPRTYTRKVLNVCPSRLIGYWPLNETAGTVAVDATRNGRNGVTTGATVGGVGAGDGNTAYSFDGTGDRVDIQTTPLAAAFDGNEGTFAYWGRVNATAQWTDSATRRAFFTLADGSNLMVANKDSANNTILVGMIAGGTTKVVSWLNTSAAWRGATIDYQHIVMTWSKSADQLKAYLNGIQQGTTQTGLGTWVGAPTATRIGANNSDTEVFIGFIAHFALWNQALTDDQIRRLATLP